MAEIPVPTVSELTAEIKHCLETSFASFQVVGEISSLSRPGSGHLYFNLKDAGATLHGVMWRTTVLRHRFKLADGMQVIARGRITIYPPRGEYQMVVEELHPKGLGAQDIALRQLKEKLAKAGYFAPERKRKLPRFPRRLALVASPTGAAIRDMLEILRRRWPCAEVWVCATRVQGEGAADDIFAAIRRLHLIAEKPDVIILGRGGGSSVDLGVFNEERVASAIFHSRIPVISAIGHEVDVTIADLVADFRAVTPSEAAERATPDRGELIEHLRNRAGRLRSLLQGRFQVASQILRKLAQRRVFTQPTERLRDQERRLDDIEIRLTRAIQRRVAMAHKQVEGRAAQLASLSPLNVLARGYSLTRLPDTGEIIRSASQVEPGTSLEILLHEGKINVRVEGNEETLQTIRVEVF